MSECVSVAEASRLISVSKSTIYGLIAAGKLKANTSGPQFEISAANLTEYIETCTVPIVPHEVKGLGHQQLMTKQSV